MVRCSRRDGLFILSWGVAGRLAGSPWQIRPAPSTGLSYHLEVILTMRHVLVADWTAFEQMCLQSQPAAWIQPECGNQIRGHQVTITLALSWFGPCSSLAIQPTEPIREATQGNHDGLASQTWEAWEWAGQKQDGLHWGTTQKLLGYHVSVQCPVWCWLAACCVTCRPQLVKGNMQLYSTEQKRAQALEAHAAAFSTLRVSHPAHLWMCGHAWQWGWILVLHGGLPDSF